MSPRELKILIATVALILSALGLEWFALPTTETLLREARTEIRVPKTTARNPVSPVRTPETRPTGEAPRRSAAARAETKPTTGSTPIAAPGPTNGRSRPLSVRNLLRTILGLRLSDDPTLATNGVDANDRQAAATYEALGSLVVANDPVNPMSGEMTYSHPIVRVPGVGLDFSFVLMYRSHYKYNGPVGYNWEHNWNARYKYNAVDKSLTHYANNRIDAYTSSDGLTFTPPTGSFEKSVTRTAAGGGSNAKALRRLQDGTVETYEELDATHNPDWYFLKKVEHRDTDNALTLEYDGGENLTRINDTRGKYFKLTYNGSQRLSSIEDHSSGNSTSDRTWTLSYSSGDLASISTPAVSGVQRVTAFGYADDHCLASVKAPREEAVSGDAYLQMAYDSNDRVTSQVFGAATQAYTLSYDTGNNRTTETNRESVRRIYYYNGTTKAITKISQEVSSGVFDDTLLAWDTSALMTKIIYPEGNGHLYQYTNGHVTASIQANAGTALNEPNISTMRAGSNHLVTEYFYQSTSNWDLLTKVTDPCGNDWKLDRDADGNVTNYKTPEYPSNGWAMTYDSRSRPVRIEDPETRARSLEYGANGTLTKTTLDPDGGGLALATVFARDKYENVVTVTDAESLMTVITRNELGFVTSVMSPEGRVTDYLYDLNDLVTETHRDYGSAFYTNAEQKTVYVYSILDIPTTMTQYYGASYGSSRSWFYGYDKEDRQTLTTLPRGNRVKSIYDYKGLRTTLRRAEGTADEKDETAAYDKNNRLTLAKDGLGNGVTRSYDPFDRSTKTIDPEGHYRTTEFDKNSNTTRARGYDAADTKLAEVTFEVDKNNRLTKRSEWAKQSDRSTSIGSGSIDTTYTFDKAGLLTQKSEPCGCGGSTSTTLAYDRASRKTKVTDAASNTVTYTLDRNGLVAKVARDEYEASVTKEYVVEYKFDSDRYLTEVDDKGGGSDTVHSVAYGVDGFGRIMTVTDANGQVMTLLRDDFGSVTKRRRRMSDSPTYLDTITTLDLNDNVVTQTSVRAGGDTYTVNLYDDADRVTTMKDEGGTPSSVVYDDADNVITSYDRNGSRSDYHYDKRNLVTEIDFSLATDVRGPTQEKFWYDGLGRTIKAYNQDGLVERVWNTLSKLESEKTWIMPTSDSGGGTMTRTVDYVFDSNGRAAEIKYPDTSSDSTRLWVRRSFDALNRVTTIDKKTGSGGSYAPVATWVFQGPSRMKTLELGNGTKETLTYDPYGRGTKLVWDRPYESGRTSIIEFKRGYDAGNRPTFERRDYWQGNVYAAQLGGDQDYGDRYYYDFADRMTKVIKGVGRATSHDHSLVESENEGITDYYVKTRYDFDEAGNRQTLHYDFPATTDAAREDNTFDTENQLTNHKLYVKVGGTPTLITNTTNTFDANGNQVTTPAVKVDMHNRIYEFGDWRYRYDPFGRRIEKHDTSIGGSWTRMYYDGVVCIDEHVTSKTGESDPVEVADSFYKRIFGPYLVDQLLWARLQFCGECAIEGFVHGDFLGTVVAITSPPGAGDPKIIEQYRYDEYGQPYFYDGDGGALTASQGAQSYLFTGREWDSELRFYYYRARYYRQDLGVFEGRDPVASHDLTSRYPYVDDDPVSSVDPMGLTKRPPSRDRVDTNGQHPPLSLIGSRLQQELIRVVEGLSPGQARYRRDSQDAMDPWSIALSRSSSGANYVNAPDGPAGAPPMPPDIHWTNSDGLPGFGGWRPVRVADCPCWIHLELSPFQAGGQSCWNYSMTLYCPLCENWFIGPGSGRDGLGSIVSLGKGRICDGAGGAGGVLATGKEVGWFDPKVGPPDPTATIGARIVISNGRLTVEIAFGAGGNTVNADPVVFM